MTAQQIGGPPARSLDVLGISEPEELAYRWLLTRSSATVAEAAQALSLSPGKMQRLVDAIEAKGLATHSPERPRRYIPASPDIALKALAFHRQEELQRVEGTIQELQEQTAVCRQSEQEHIVELITSREAERQIVEQMSRTAQHEVVALVRPPMLISRLDLPAEQDNYTQREARARGVSSRSIVDGGFLALPGAVARTRSNVKAGEDVRVLPSLPFKMVLSDRRLALIPLKLQEPCGPSLIARSSALLDALYALFEILWERATPLSFTPAGVLEDSNPGSRFPEGAEDMLSLLIAGINDKGIVYELEISRSTFTRRLAEIMKAMDARTRFQLGYLTALRLSTGSSEQTTTRAA